MPEQIDNLERPSVFSDVPPKRYWGDRTPPKNRADMFSTTVRAAADTGTSSADGAASSGTVATLRMYGPIDSWGGFWGISARDVSAALDTLDDDVTEIRLRINSPGGDAWEGMAISNMLRAHKARVVAVVDGIAASAASYIATSADETVMSPGTQLMIHDASAFAYGPAATMRKAATFLDSVSNSIASLYAEAAGGTDQQWRALMVEETWYTAQEAVDAGLADRVGVVTDAGDTATSGGDEPDPEPAAPEDAFDLSIFNYAGRSHAPAPQPPAASADGFSNTTTEGGSAVAFTDEQITDMRRKLGIAEDADETTILAALTEALDEHAEPAAATDVPDGHVVVPEARLRDLEAAAQQGVGAAQRLHEQERERFLTENASKYLPANRAAWAKEFDRSPENARKHFENAPVLVPVDQLGHDGEPDTTEADEVYNSLFGDEKAGATR